MGSPRHGHRERIDGGQYVLQSSPAAVDCSGIPGERSARRLDRHLLPDWLCLGHTICRTTGRPSRTPETGAHIAARNGWLPSRCQPDAVAPSAGAVECVDLHGHLHPADRAAADRWPDGARAARPHHCIDPDRAGDGYPAFTDLGGIGRRTVGMANSLWRGHAGNGGTGVHVTALAATAQSTFGDHALRSTAAFAVDLPAA